LKRLSDKRFATSFYGLEISQTGVELTRKREIENLIECKLFDGYSLPYEDGQFDLTILSHVVEHVEHPRMLLHEAGRVADHMFVEVPLEDNYRQKKNYVSNEDKEGHINPYSPTTIRWLLQTSGFDVLKQIVTIPGYAVFRHSLGRKALLVYPL